MPEAAGEYADIPALLKGILNGYPGNSAIFREYLQNSDDAGASSQIFILDERTYAHQSLLDPILADSQGPALVCINNGILEEADWKALQSIHSSSKVADETRTGKNGLGFRASYHLTENPHLFSGRKLVVLDAHRHFQRHPGGVGIDVVTEGGEYEDQLSAFAPIVGNPREYFAGTVFRLPLRTDAQAARSRIKDTATHPDEILELLRLFCRDELEEVVLFLKHVANIEIRHISNEGIETLLGKVVVHRPQESISGTYHCRITVTGGNGVQSKRDWCFYHLSIDKADAKAILDSRLQYDVGEKLVSEKLTPVVDLAFPMNGTPIKSRLYTLLPLPITTDFPLHINAVFALTPDRQSLKNSLEVGVRKSREKLLVEWNKVLFTTWIPIAWARLLADLTRSFETRDSVRSYWLLWPPDQPPGNTYWAALSHYVVLETIKQARPIFPTLGDTAEVGYASLKDSNVLVSPPSPGIALNILWPHVIIVQPPEYVFSILSKLRSDMAAPFLSPETLYRRLREVYTADRFPICTPEEARVIVDYLARINVEPTLSFIAGIRLFTLTDGSRVSLGSVSANYIIPSTEKEEQLFASHRLMLAWDCMSDRFRKFIMTPANLGILNTASLKVEHIASVLHSRFGQLKPPLHQIKVEDFTWLIDFWKWLAQWPDIKSFFKKEKSEKIANLYLLPTSERSLRKFSLKSFVFGGTDQAAVDAWNMLGVYPLHRDILDDEASKMKAVVERPQSMDFVPLLLRTCNPSLQKNVSQDALLSIQKSICSSIPLRTSNNTPFKLARNERLKLCMLKVFATKSTNADAWSLNSLEGTSEFRYLSVTNHFLLPIERHSVVYVNMQDQNTKALAKMANDSFPRVYSEIDLIKIGFDNWNMQPSEVQDMYVAWMFRNRTSVPQEILRRMDNLEFVKAHRTERRIAPHGLINPKSPVAKLYTDESARLPTELFATEYLPIMRELGYLHSHLDAFVVEERLKFLSSNAVDPSLLRKAKDFINLCNREWKPEFAAIIQRMKNQPWMPVNDSTFESPVFCRDSIGTRGTHENPFFYDLILKILPPDVQIISPAFRKALGWSDVIASQTLVTQFRLTLQLEDDREQSARLIALIDYLSYLDIHGQLSSDSVQDLKDMLTDKAWIPVTSSPDGGLVKASYALFSDNVDLKPPFRQVHNFELTPFLVKMGCTPRPTLEVLEEELRMQEYTNDREVAAAVSVLQEVVSYHAEFDRSTLFVPAENNSSVPIENVFFKDTRVTKFASTATGLVQAHDMISRALADALHIPCSSTLNFESFAGDDDDDEDDNAQMSEDFVTRIRGFLREYDVRYALNEFLANADDAGATKFSILLDKLPVGGDGYLSPELESLMTSPSLFLYNNALMTEEDFEGLLKVGRGGKHGRSETHGRHGLGALSFYYFTDVVTVISGGQIMFLDPSGTYLPRRRYGLKRTGLRKPLVQFSEQYLDQLKSYDSFFGFSPFSPNYEGTLFILPLRSSISEQPCGLVETHDLLKSNYQILSENAFFFTRLQHISAEEKMATERVKMWSFSASRSSPVTLGQSFTRYELSLECVEGTGGPTIQKWLIATSPHEIIPEEHKATATMLKLDPDAAMNVQLAIRTDVGNSSHFKSFLFSSLSLPKVVSLPFHVSARFAISSNRQSIVLDPRDSDHQVDPKTAYNLWILESLVPPLYLSSFEFLLHSHQRANRFYARRWWLLDSSDDLSNIVKNAFLSMLPASENRVLKNSASTPSWISFRNSVFSVDEPPSVTAILTKLVPTEIVIPAGIKELSELPSVYTINAGYAKKVLLQQRSLVLLRDALKDKIISNKDIARMLDYVHKEVPLAGLPLVVLSTSKLTLVPGETDPVVYRSRAAHATLFSSTSFLMGTIYTEDTLLAIFRDPTNNIFELTAERTLPLIERTLAPLNAIQLNDWVGRFWESYKDLPGPPPLQSLERENLKLVKASSGYVSLVSCTPSTTVFDAELTPDRRLLPPILQKMGISFLIPGNNVVLTEYLKTKFGAFIDNVLLCMQSVGITRLNSKLDINEQRALANWIRDPMIRAIMYGSGLPGIQKAFLLALPIWEAQTYQGSTLHSCTGLKLIPEHVNIQNIRPFQRIGCVTAKASYDITQLLRHGLGAVPKTVSPKVMMDIVVQIPPRFTAENEAQLNLYRDFLRDMLRYPRNELQHAEIHIPDRTGTMRRISDLFDDTIALFSTSLEYTERSSFPHPTLRTLFDDLRGLGLKYAVNLPNFRTSASAIEQALQTFQVTATPDRNTLMNMADVAFNVYQDELPAMLMVNQAAWGSLDEIKFMRPHGERRRGASYDVVPYCETELPALLSPSQFVSQTFEPIAWTQRALFFREPSEELLALNRSLGLPSAEEVVKHLNVLVTKIAPEHPRNNTVLHDLKATYKWLNDNYEESREALLLFAEVPLFLNVDDPTEETWEGKWEKASNLVINFAYDQAQLKRVRTFLREYEKLLIASGSSTLNSVNRIERESPESERSSALNDMLRRQAIFNEMRLAGQLTDVVLVPSTRPTADGVPTVEDDTHDSLDDPLLRAHRSFLAAALPYIRESIDGWLVTPKIKFYGTATGAKALLDFVYTGNFDLSEPKANQEELATTLQDLLELLPIADEWDIPALKLKIEETIVHTHDMIQRLPQEYQNILFVAQQCRAEKVLTALNEFKAQNGLILQAFGIDIS